MFVAKVKDNPAAFSVNVKPDGAADGTDIDLLRVDEWKRCKGDNAEIEFNSKFTLSVASDQKDKLEELTLIIKFSGSI